MIQYEIRWAKLPEPVRHRPVLLLTRTSAYAYLNRVIIVEITTTIRAIPQEVRLGRREGLARACVANFDQLHLVPKACLGDVLGRLAPSKELEVKRALGHALDWAELKALVVA
ncbi:MAG TPA: type II toxin-antitoxin system PemK/MazF family toxin [Polyangiaceae bacterium]|nr:type II toxin-antitoxin system PemK/MazF family toxin [Polyangiaceae bacterium]